MPEKNQDQGLAVVTGASTGIGYELSAIRSPLAELAPPFGNRALLLLYLDERSYREIADILGISETNVSTKINRLKERLRRFGETHGTR